MARRVIALITAGAAVIFGSVYFLTRPPTFSEHGVSLNYPREWELVNGPFTPPAGIDLLWTQGFALDDENGAGVAAANIGTAVPEQFLRTAARRSLEPAIREAVESSGGSLSGPDTIEIAGRDGLLYRVTGVALATSVADVSLAVVGEGSTVYFIACQSTPDARDAVEDGCTMIRESFAIGD